MHKPSFPVFFILFGALLVSPFFVYGQSCFSGSTWEGPSGSPPLANRTWPIYSSCGSTQQITGNIAIDASGGALDEPGLLITHDGSSDYPALQATLSAGTLVAQFGDATSYGNNAAGQSLRLQDTTQNPEIQLQYGAVSDQHWSIYANTIGDDSLKFWSYDGGGFSSDVRMTILQGGNVGIGTETPSQKLEVEGIIRSIGPNGTGAEGGMMIRNQYAGSTLTGGLRIGGITSEQKYTDLYWADASNFYINVASGGARNFHVLNTSNGINMYFGNQTYSASNSATFYSDVDIEGSLAVVDGTEGTGKVLVSDASGNASWQDVTTVATSDVFWKLNGTDLYASSTTWDVGVGTTDPAEDFHIADALGPRLLLTREGSASTGDWLGQIMFESRDGGYSTDDTAPAVIRAITPENHGTSNKGGELIFMTKQAGFDTAQPAVERMRIEHDGDIKVGTNSDVSRLIVSSGNTTTGGLFVSRYAADNQGLRVYATDRDLYTIYNEDSGEGSPGKWHFINQLEDGSVSNEFMTAAWNATDGQTYVGIYNTLPSYELDVNGDIRATTYYATSDARLKENITDVDPALERIKNLRPVRFTWRADDEHVPMYGLIAQEVEKIYPDMVSTTSEGYKSVAYDQLIPILIKGMQEQQTQIDSLEQRIADLEKSIKKLTE